MIGEPYGSTYPHLGHPLDHSIQDGLATTPTPDVGPPYVEEGRTNFSSPHVLATYNYKINGEAGSMLAAARLL